MPIFAVVYKLQSLCYTQKHNGTKFPIPAYHAIVRVAQQVGCQAQQ